MLTTGSPSPSPAADLAAAACSASNLAFFRRSLACLTNSSNSSGGSVSLFPSAPSVSRAGLLSRTKQSLSSSSSYFTTGGMLPLLLLHASEFWRARCKGDTGSSSSSIGTARWDRAERGVREGVVGGWSISRPLPLVSILRTSLSSASKEMLLSLVTDVRDRGAEGLKWRQPCAFMTVRACQDAAHLFLGLRLDARTKSLSSLLSARDTLLRL